MGKFYALSKISIFSNESERIFIVDKNTSKLGRGALVWFILESNLNLTVAYRRYISCDGNIGSGVFDTLSSTLKNKDDRLEDIENKILASENQMQLNYVYLQNRTEMDKKNKEILKAASTIACKQAVPEVEGDLFPFVQTSFDKNNTATIFALMSGTFYKKSGAIEGWIKEYRVQQNILKDSEGINIKLATGESLTNKEFKNDGFNLTQVSIKCQQKTIAIIKTVAYDQYSNVNDSRKYQIEYSEPIPSSIGARWISEICKIYN